MGPKALVQGPVRRRAHKSHTRRQRADSIPSSIESTTATLVEEESAEDLEDTVVVVDPEYQSPITESCRFAESARPRRATVPFTNLSRPDFAPSRPMKAFGRRMSVDLSTLKSFSFPSTPPPSEYSTPMEELSPLAGSNANCYFTARRLNASTYLPSNLKESTLDGMHAIREFELAVEARLMGVGQDVRKQGMMLPRMISQKSRSNFAGVVRMTRKMSMSQSASQMGEGAVMT